MTDISNAVKANEQYMIDLRRWFHRHPELSMQETGTVERIKQELDRMGIENEVLEGGHGVGAVIRCGQGDKVIAARADIDALAVEEETGLPFKSCQNGLMHACGHDAHMAMLLGAAKTINEMKDELHGTVKLLFQAGEEIGLGHTEVLDYLEKTGGTDQVIGLHIWNTVPSGELLILPGGIFGGARPFRCHIKGKGGHGARPDLAHDPVKTACELALKYASIPSNFYDVLDHSVVSTGLVKAGSGYNIFPAEAEIEGSIRYFKRGGNVALQEIMARIAEGVARIYGTEIELTFGNGCIPVYNDAAAVDKVRALVPQIEGLVLSKQSDPICGGDNICYLLDKYPGFYAVLGGAVDENAYPQHHPKFDIDESAFRKGAELMVRYMADYLN